MADRQFFGTYELDGLEYEPSTGVFTWSKALKNQSAGKQAGIIEAKGYRQIMLHGHRYKAHRLAWLIMTGEWPRDQIDHINGVKDDNRFANLREATNAQNKRNGNVRADSKSGYKGVHWHRQSKKWRVVIKFEDGQNQRGCGYFSELFDAVACANWHIAYIHGAFARLNKIPLSYCHD